MANPARHGSKSHFDMGEPRLSDQLNSITDPPRRRLITTLMDGAKSTATKRTQEGMETRGRAFFRICFQNASFWRSAAARFRSGVQFEVQGVKEQGGGDEGASR
jgi:hypothetical protein